MAAAVAREATVAANRPAHHGSEVPRAAAHHTDSSPTLCRPLRVNNCFGFVELVPILAPLPHIAVHVKQTKPVRLLLANGMSGTVAIGCKPGYTLQVIFSIARIITRACPGAAGVFPLGLGRQADSLC